MKGRTRGQGHQCCTSGYLPGQVIVATDMEKQKRFSSPVVVSASSNLWFLFEAVVMQNRRIDLSLHVVKIILLISRLVKYKNDGF